MTNYSEIYPDFKIREKLSSKSEKRLKKLQKSLKLGKNYRYFRIKLKLSLNNTLKIIKIELKPVLRSFFDIFLPVLVFIFGFLVQKIKLRRTAGEIKNSVLIFNGKFFNEGAQAMSLIAIEQIK